jgi:hypothetical protein
MTYNLVFQYKDHGRFPEERTQDAPIVLKAGEVVIPDVGDHVTYAYDGLPTDFEVLARHFTYSGNECSVNIEVGAASHLHKALSLKE